MKKSLFICFIWFFLKISFFGCGPFFKKSLLNLLQYCFCFMFFGFLAWGMWNPSSPIRDWTCNPALEGEVSTTRPPEKSRFKCFLKGWCWIWKSYGIGTSLAVQWLRLCSSTAEDKGLIPGQGTKIPHATWHSQNIKIINK